MHTLTPKRKSNRESGDERQLRKLKKRKSGTSKSDEDKDECIPHQGTFHSTFTARYTGRTRKQRKPEGMVPWADIDPNTGYRIANETDRSHKTAISPTARVLNGGQGISEESFFGANPENEDVFPGMNCTPSATRRAGNHSRRSSKTGRFQDLCSHHVSHYHLDGSVASSASPQANQLPVFGYVEEQPVTTESPFEEFPDFDEMMNQKAPTWQTAQDIFHRRKEPVHRAVSCMSETIRPKAQTVRSKLLPTVDDNFVSYNDTTTISANETSQLYTSTVSEDHLPTPTSTTRSSSVTPHHKAVTVRLWIITSMPYYRQTRWREGVLRKKTLHGVINAIAERLGMVGANIKALKCVLQAGAKELSDTVRRQDEAGFAEMKGCFNEEIEKTLTTLGGLGEKKFDIFVEPLEEFEGMREGEVDDDDNDGDGKGWL